MLPPRIALLVRYAPLVKEQRLVDLRRHWEDKDEIIRISTTENCECQLCVGQVKK